MRVRIDHDSAEFPYLQLARIIRERIRAGEFPPGSKLPTINEITGETGLSPMTIRRAYRELADVAEVVPGRGTFVRQRE